MGLSLRTFASGTVEINPVNTSSNVSVDIRAANGRLSHTDSATGGMFLPVGTTAQRPASPVAGQIRFNTTTGAVEVYSGSAWG